MRASAAVEVFAFLQHCFTVDFVVLVIQVCVSCLQCAGFSNSVVTIKCV